MAHPVPHKRSRRVVLALYIAVALFICVSAAISTYQGAKRKMGSPPPPTPREKVDAKTLSGCMHELEVLSKELNRRLNDTLASWPARRSSVQWEDWSPAWRTKLLALDARCRLSQGDVSGTKELKAAYQRLSELHRHYTTLAVQFSKEIGPSADRLQAAMKRARQSVLGRASNLKPVDSNNVGNN